MAIYTLGSINIDHVYGVSHLPLPGETIAASSYSTGLGGKGANQSVAAAKASARVLHIGSVGYDGARALSDLQENGVDVTHVAESTTATGHAIITVNPEAENSIVLFSGANQQITDAHVMRALGFANSHDTLMMQNETSAQSAAARLGFEMGLRILYSAAPFDVITLRDILPYASLLMMNEGEAEELRASLGSLPEIDLIVTKGAAGADWYSTKEGPLFMPSFRVTPVDTTGAGDCFAGTIAAALDSGLGREQAMLRATAAAAIQVTRPGAASAMPTAAEVDGFLVNV